MLSFQGLHGQVQSLCNDDNSTTLTLLKNFINQTQSNLLARRKDITEKSATEDTVASQQAYELPYDYGKMFHLTVTVGSIAYPVLPIEDDQTWLDRNARSSSFTSDIPQFYYIFNDQVYLYPTPTSSSNTITMYYHKRVKAMTFDNYTTGTVDIITNGATAVTGSGTTWTAPMIGRFLSVTPSATATADGDGIWYEIDTRTSDTVIGLKRNYQGTSLTTGASASYIIGEMPTIPEPYHELLIWRPVALYYQQKGQFDKSKIFWELYKDMEKQFINDRSSKVESAIISGDMVRMKQRIHGQDPNKFPLNLTS